MAKGDNPEQVKEFADAALERIKSLGISATPANYTLWYSYYEGSNQDLNRTLDALVEDRETISERDTADTLHRFFGGEDQFEAGIRYSRQIQGTAEQMVDVLNSAGKDAERYGRALEMFSGGLESAKNEEDVPGMIQSILSETRAMETQNRKLKFQVEASAKEIGELKERLADARRDAMTDPLTNISNRKAFDRALEAEMTRAQETGEPLSLILCDLDHFKSFNDTHGHQIGDQVLRLVAQTLVQCVKGQDTAARYGGEEFAVILPGTNVMGAASVGEFIRTTVASKKIVKKGSGTSIGGVTLSMGVASCQPGEAAEELIERTDKALYSAKHNGRNRVIADKGTRPKAVANNR